MNLAQMIYQQYPTVGLNGFAEEKRYMGQKAQARGKAR
jgi:hypothetical protein